MKKFFKVSFILLLFACCTSFKTYAKTNFKSDFKNYILETYKGVDLEDDGFSLFSGRKNRHSYNPNDDIYIIDKDNLNITSINFTYTNFLNTSSLKNPIDDSNKIANILSCLDDCDIEFFTPKIYLGKSTNVLTIWFNMSGMGTGTIQNKYSLRPISFNLNTGEIYESRIVNVNGYPYYFFEYELYHIGNAKNINALIRLINSDLELDYYTAYTTIDDLNNRSPLSYICNDLVNDEIIEAHNIKIIPTLLIHEKDLKKSCKSKDFYDIAYNSLLHIGHISPETSYPIDTCNLNYSKQNYAACYLANQGIIDKNDNGDFELDRLVTREEAAKMLYLSAIKLGAKAPTSDMSNIKYHDDATFSPWARYYIKAVNYLDIMYGVGNNNFGPHEYVTREEIIVAYLRILKKYLPECF